MQELRLRTPVTLYEELIEAHLADAHPLENDPSAIESGHLFPSKLSTLEEALQAVHRYLKEHAQAPRALLPMATDWKSYVKSARVEDRQSLVLDLQTRSRKSATVDDARSMTLSLYLLESTILRRRGGELARALLQYGESETKDPRAAELREIAKKVKGTSQVDLLDPGYGVPLHSSELEDSTQSAPGLKSWLDRNKCFVDQLTHGLGSEVELIQRNLALLRTATVSFSSSAVTKVLELLRSETVSP